MYEETKSCYLAAFDGTGYVNFILGRVASQISPKKCHLGVVADPGEWRLSARTKAPPKLNAAANKIRIPHTTAKINNFNKKFALIPGGMNNKKNRRAF